jgi:copper transport protein
MAGMTDRRRAPRAVAPRAAAAFGGLLLGLLAVLFGPAGPASAHAALLRTTPAAGTIVTSLPTEVVLTFSEPVRMVPDKVHALGPNGQVVDTGPTMRGNELHVPLRPGSPNGTYLVSYRVISVDSHPVGGGVVLYVGQSSGAPPDPDAAQRTDRGVAIALAAARYVGYAGLILLVGPAFMLALLWPKRLSRRVPLRLLAIGVGAIAVSALAELYLQAPYASGTGLFGASAGDLRDALNSRYGAAHIIRLGVVAAVAVLVRPIVRAPVAQEALPVREKALATGGAEAEVETATGDEPPPPPAAPGADIAAANRAAFTDRALLAILAVVGLATWPLSGHSGASTLPEVTAIADVAHLAAMSLWLGGLVVLVAYLLPKATGRELAAVLPEWSRWAFRAVVVLVIAGTVQALVEIGSFSALFGTTYGRVLLLKIGLLELIVLVAAYSRQLARVPDAEVADANRGRLRRSVLVELVLAAVVIGAASTLVQTTPARTAVAAAPAEDPGLYSARLTSQLYTLQVDIDPVRTGQDSIHLVATTPQGGPLKVLEWQVTAGQPAKGIEPITVPTLKITDDHAVGQAQLPTPGPWEFKFTLRTTDIDEATVTATVDVKQ